MANPSQTPERGLLATAKRFWENLRELLENRLDLFLVELKEERIRLFDALLVAAVAIICTGMTLVLVTFTIVVVFWDDHRLLALGALSLAYAVGTGAAFWSLRRRLRQWEAFRATREQLKKDQACLGTQN